MSENEFLDKYWFTLCNSVVPPNYRWASESSTYLRGLIILPVNPLLLFLCAFVPWWLMRIRN
jgi:hypothetical protein